MRSLLTFATSLALCAAACGGPSTGASAPGGATLKVTAVEPATGTPAGGQPVVIRGAGFMAESRAIEVYVGEAPATVIAVASDSELQIEAPAGEPGAAVDVRVVFEPGGELRLPQAFTFSAN